MGFFDINSASGAVLEQELKDPKELERAYLFSELARLSDEEKADFIKSEACARLQEAGLISKKTLVRLSKTDDLSRRRKMAAFQIAKERKDPLWSQLVKNRIKERQLIKAIMAKYATGAEKAARVGQRSYLKSIGNKMAPIR